MTLAANISAGEPDLAQAVRLFRSGDLAEAESACRRAVRRDPADASALRLLGVLAGRRGHAADSLRFLEAAVRLRPNDPDALNDLGVTREPLFNRSGRAWDGSDPFGHTILLYAEGGLGNTIQFMRYVPVLARLGARLIVESQPPLKALLGAVNGVWKLVARGEQARGHDL